MIYEFFEFSSNIFSGRRAIFSMGLSAQQTIADWPIRARALTCLLYASEYMTIHIFELRRILRVRVFTSKDVNI